MKIFLLKDFSKDYEKAITDKGYTVEFKPVLSSHSINHEKMKETFMVSPSIKRYDAMIVTSRNAFRSIKEGDLVRNIHSDWLYIPIFCVGPATQALGQSIGFQNCQGKDCGNALALATNIISQYSNLSSFLFLTGDKTKSTITESLISAGFHVDLLQVYETRNQEVEISDLIGSIVVLFSPSGIKSLGKTLLDFNAANIYWISIGPSTFQALADIGVQSMQAESPTPEGVVQALQKLKI